MRLARTLRAERDLTEIWIYIAGKSERAADRMLDELQRRSDSLCDFPYLGRSRPEIRDDVRCLTVGSYLILYRLNENEVAVVRYVHGRRDLKQVI